MTVREMVAKLGLDFDAQSFFKAEVAFKALQGAFDLVVAAGEKLVDVLEKSIVGTAQQARTIGLLSEKTGVGTTALQELAFAGERNGLSLEEMGTAMFHLSRHMQAAQQGNEEAARAFNAIGLSVGQLRGKKPEEMMLAIAEHFSKLPANANRAGIAMELFGRAGAQLVPLLNKGRVGITDLMKEAEDLGVVMDEHAIKSGEEFAGLMARIKARGESLARTFGGPLIDALNPLLKQYLEWAKANKDITKARIERFAKALVSVFTALGKIVAWLYRNMDFLAIVIGSVLTPILIAQIGEVASLVSWYVALGIQAVLAGDGAAAAWLAAAAPIALMVAALIVAGLVAEDLYYFLTDQNSLIGELGPKWNKFLDDLYAKHEGDPQWLEALKSAGSWLADLADPAKYDRVLVAFANLMSKIVGMAASAGRMVIQSLTGIDIGDKSVAAAKAFGALAGAQMVGGASPLKDLLTPGQSMFGGGGAPAASAAAIPAGYGTGAFLVAPNMKAEITVNAAPGQSAHDVAGQIPEQMDKWFDSKMQEVQAQTGT